MIDRDEFKTNFGKLIFDRYLSVFQPEEIKNEISEETPEDNSESQRESIEDIVEKDNDTKLFVKIPEKDEPHNFFSEHDVEKKEKNVNYQTPISKGIEITPYTITQYLKKKGVIGEEGLGNILTVAIANGMHVIVEGVAGSGKTYIVDKVLDLFEKDKIYELGLASGQAIWKNTDEINAHDIIYLPELQKAVADNGHKTSSVIEFLKNITEGKDARKITTNSRRDGVDVSVIENGKTIVSTIAKENNFKYDRETERRFLILETDNSYDHIDNIINNKLEKCVSTNINSDELSNIEAALSERVKYVRSNGSVRVLNPFIGYLAEIIPRTTKSQSYIDHYINLFEAWGRFFSKERERVQIEGEEYVLLEVSDAYNVFNMYHSHFMNIVGEDESTSSPPNFDWMDCFEKGTSKLETSLSYFTNSSNESTIDYDDVLSEWRDRQLVQGRLIVNSYLSGENIDISDKNDEV